MSLSPNPELDFYYNCKMRPTTPTMVSNFILPNSRINKNGPYLEVEQQPQSKFRFRYLSEMGGTHGQLKAETTDKNKNVFPTVKLCNWEGGPALIQLQLYTAEANANDRKKHVHELNGKNVNKAGITGGCEMVVDQTNKYSATFPNLGIIHIAKRDVSNIIYQRKRQEKINSTHTNSNVKHNISPTDLQKLKEEANDEARNMNLNKVVLRFQAFFFNEKMGIYLPITDSVDSDVIFNLKNAQTGELKMVRISAVSAPCTGGTEIWMLVEKVKKSNVKIKFSELDEEGCEIWKAYGEFKESDVHHQFAIVFKAPAYRLRNIREPVHVKVQLERPSDGDTSEPIDFQYTPEISKRPMSYDEGSMPDMDLNPYKRQRNVIEPVNLKIGKSNNLFLASGEKESARQSPSHMVPSPIAFVSSPSNREFYSQSPQSVGQSCSPAHVSPQSQTSYSDDPLSHPTINAYDQFMDMIPTTQPEPLHHHRTQMRKISPPPVQSQSFGNLLSPPATSPFNYKQEVPALSPNNLSPSYNQMSPYSHGGSATSPYNQDSMLSPYNNSQTGMSTFNYNGNSPIYINQFNGDFNNGSNDRSNLVKTNVLGGDTVQEQIKQCDAVIDQVIQSHNGVSPPVNVNHDFTNLVCESKPATQYEHCDLFEFMNNNENMFIAPMSLPGDIQADCVQGNERKALQGRSSGSLIKSRDEGRDDIQRGMEKLVIKCGKDDLIKSRNERIHGLKLKDDENGARNFKNEEKNVTKSKFEGSDLDIITDKIASVQIKEKSDDVEEVRGKGDSKMKVRMVGQESDAKTSYPPAKIGYNAAFDIAVRAAECLQEYAATGDIGPLLATHRYLLAVQNNSGDNSLHTAVGNRNYTVFHKILLASVEILCKDILNAVNYSGETPLHIATSLEEVRMVKDLLATPGCSLAIRDNEGNTPLHIAASLNDFKCLAVILMQNAQTKGNSVEKIINDYNYYGETPLHMAVTSGNLRNVSLLLRQGALVHLCERKRGTNPLHLAVIGGNEEIAQYLIDNTNITVDAGMFDGNTALHIATQAKNKELCSMLIKAKANPLATNNLHKSKTKSRLDNKIKGKELVKDKVNETIKEREFVTCEVNETTKEKAFVMDETDKRTKEKEFVKGDIEETTQEKEFTTEEVEAEKSDADVNESSEEESEECFTPVDYAEGDVEIISILNGEALEGKEKFGLNKDESRGDDSGIDLSLTISQPLNEGE